MQTKTIQKHTLKLWKEVTLGEVCEKIQDGTHFSPKTIQDGRYKYITSKNIRMGKLDLTNIDYLSEADHNAIYSRCRVAKGDVLLTKDGANTGNVCINPLDEEFSLLSSVAFMRADSSQADNKYIYQWLASDRTQYMIHDSMAGQAITRITLTKLNDYPLLLPPLPEQNRIVAVLEIWDRAIEALTKKIDIKKQVKKGLMQELLTGKTRLKGFDENWKHFKFKDVIFDIWDFRGRTPLKLGMKWGGGNIPALSANNVKSGYIDLSSECHLASETLYKKWMNKGDLQKGDIIFTMEAPLGNVAMIADNQKYLLSQRVVSFKISKDFDNCFVYHYLLSAFFQGKLKMLATGSTAKGVNQKALSKISFFTPNINEQKAIADFLTIADDEIYTLEKKLILLKNQKKYLLNNLITGEIRTPENLTLYS